MEPEIQSTIPESHDTATESTAEGLAKAVRALVREELNQPEPAKSTQQPPTWVDGVWLLALISNAVFLVTLVPSEWWKDPAIEEIGKVLPWLGGGTFVLGATWFKDRLLRFSRHKSFKVTMAVALVPLVLLHLPIIPLQPTVAPPGTVLKVDGDRKDGDFSNGQEILWLKLSSHTFTIVPKGGAGQKDSAEQQGGAGQKSDKGAQGDAAQKGTREAQGGAGLPEREIKWSWFRLARTWWAKKQPRWALIYEVAIKSDGLGSVVRIVPSDERFDPDFKDDLLTKVGDSWEFRPEDKAATISLPFGKYDMTVTKPACSPLTLKGADVPGELQPPTIKLNGMACGSR